jgi:hypothetical protein
MKLTLEPLTLWGTGHLQAGPARLRRGELAPLVPTPGTDRLPGAATRRGLDSNNADLSLLHEPLG